MTRTLRFSGAIPANLLPFNDDLSFDEVNYRKHLSWLAAVDGVDAIVCNGHAGEVSSLDREERRRALAIAADEVGSRVELISGIYTDNTLEAAELARDARAEGAAGLLVFPPTLFMWGARLRPEMAVVHFETIAEATDLPLIVFEYPPASGIGYDPGDPGAAGGDRTRGGGQGLEQRHGGAGGQPAGAARHRPARGHAEQLHHVAVRELRAGSRRLHLGDGKRHRGPARGVCSAPSRPGTWKPAAGSTTAWTRLSRCSTRLRSWTCTTA